MAALQIAMMVAAGGFIYQNIEPHVSRGSPSEFKEI